MSTNGKHKVIVTSEGPVGTEAALAWAKATYARLIRSDTPVDHQTQAEPEADEAPISDVHQVPMVRVHGRKGPFWSCHERNEDGNWCRYKPAGYSAA